jgi:hypothetical protein
MGRWIEIKPKTKIKYPWHFAYYCEAPSENSDNEWYVSFLFRNDDRSIFGRQEYSGKNYQRVNFQKMAVRTALDDAYRKTMISDDPLLPKLWKRH